MKLFWFIGSTVPDNSIGQDGNYYYQTTTGKIYQKISDNWVYVKKINPNSSCPIHELDPDNIISFVGPTGPTGPVGPAGIGVSGAITSNPTGPWVKITDMEFNPLTGDIRIVYST